jgi:Glycosyl transferase family 2
MKVTIGIPVYNCERWIKEAIISALNQTWQDKEIIVVDDASTDQTAALCRSFGERIRYIRQAKLGGNVARNRIVKESMGEWIQFLDADDYLKSEKIEIQLTSRHNLDDVDVIYSPVINEDWRSGNCASRWVKRIQKDDDLVELWITRKFPQIGGCLWKKDAILRIGGWNEAMRWNQDTELYLRALQAHLCFHFVADPLAVYRIWSHESVCQRDPDGLKVALTGLINLCQKWLRAEAGWTPTLRRLAGRFCFETARKLATTDLALATGYYEHQRALGLIDLQAPVASWKYLIMLKLLGFRRAEALARALRKQNWRIIGSWDRRKLFAKHSQPAVS